MVTKPQRGPSILTRWRRRDHPPRSSASDSPSPISVRPQKTQARDVHASGARQEPNADVPTRLNVSTTPAKTHLLLGIRRYTRHGGSMHTPSNGTMFSWRHVLRTCTYSSTQRTRAAETRHNVVPWSDGGSRKPRRPTVSYPPFSPALSDGNPIPSCAPERGSSSARRQPIVEEQRDAPSAVPLTPITNNF